MSEGVPRAMCLALACAVSFYGCSSDVYKTFTLDKEPTTSVSLDARQRVVLSTDKAGENHKSRVICAEPSPDALVSVAASGLLKVPIGNQSFVEADARSTESVSRLGARTQTIQLLRDALYRACEGYLNGAISKPQYLEILYMYDDFVVTLLAIEHLANLHIAGPMNAGLRTAPATNSVREPEDLKAPAVASQSMPVVSGAIQLSPAVQASSAFGEVPQVIKEIVFKYLDNQMRLYEGMREDK